MHWVLCGTFKMAWWQFGACNKNIHIKAYVCKYMCLHIHTTLHALIFPNFPRFPSSHMAQFPIILWKNAKSAAMSSGFRGLRNHLVRKDESAQYFIKQLWTTFQNLRLKPTPPISHHSSDIRWTAASLANTYRRWIFNDSFVQDWNLLPFWQYGLLLLTCTKEEDSDATCWGGNFFFAPFREEN